MLQFFIWLLLGLGAHALEVIWNVPSVQCKNVRPDIYNITTNAGRKFRGEKFVIFYESDLGLYPWCEKGPNDVKNECQVKVNGGVPQAVNMSAHLIKVREDVVRAIPDPDYANLAIIDYEAWRPLFDLNWSNRRVYRRYSMQLIRERYPDLPNDSAEYLSRYLFDYHAKNFLIETIRAARETRPKAKWAFWDYPLCNYDVGYKGDMECLPEYEIINGQLLWMFNESDVILPPIYFYEEYHTPDERQRHVYARIQQANLINEKLFPKKLPIYAYTKIEYDVKYFSNNNSLEELYYSKSDLCNSIKFPADLGINGIVIWGTSKYMKQRCQSMSEYVSNLLGPFTSAVLQKTEKCAQKLCNGHGRCTAIDSKPPMKCELAHQPEMKCNCDYPYTGENCEINIGDDQPTETIVDVNLRQVNYSEVLQPTIPPVTTSNTVQLVSSIPTSSEYSVE
ncbi:Hyaluronidase [Aphelenchoides besseyi]|nr:Hyaluronidase [Aphelenchoides besseyi]